MANANPRWANLSAPAESIQVGSDSVPSAVLQTAVAAAGNDTALTAITWHDYSEYSFTLYEQYADVQNTQLRQFLSYTGGTVSQPFKPLYLTRSTLYTTSFRAPDGSYNTTLVATNISALPRMINARSRSTFASRTRTRCRSLVTVSTSSLCLLPIRSQL